MEHTQSPQKPIENNSSGEQSIAKPSRGFLHHFSHHYHHRYRRRFPLHHKKIFIFDCALIAIGLIIGTIATYYFLQKPTFRPIEISIAAQDKKIITGSEHTWEFQIKNTSKKQLHRVVTTLTFPESFKILAPSDANASGTPESQTRVWQIDKLSGKENTAWNAKGRISAPVGEAIKIIARTEGLTDTQATFSETNVLMVQTTDPALLTTFDLPQSVFTGESFPFIITYANKSDAPLTRPILRFEFPSSFILNNKPSSWKDQSLTLPTLAPGARGSVELNGTLTADPRAPRISIAVHTSADQNGKRVIQEDLLPSLTFKPTGIKISLKSLETNGTPGSPLHLTLSLDHTGSESFQKVSICVPLNNQNINFASVKGEGRFFENQYCITPEEDARLAEIKNSFHGEWPLTLLLPSALNLPDQNTNKNAVLALTTNVSFTAPHTPPIQISLIGSELRIPITTTLTFQAIGRYFTNEGDQLGRGPLPPQAGKMTKYWIAWAINSSANSVKNLIIRATLPPSIQWSGKSTVNKGKNITYDAATREVRWTHELLEPTDDACACAEGGFEISFTPSGEDAGTIPMLVRNISVDGIDGWTDKPVHTSAPDITSELSSDPFAEGKGRVQR